MLRHVTFGFTLLILCYRQLSPQSPAPIDRFAAFRDSLTTVGDADALRTLQHTLDQDRSRDAAVRATIVLQRLAALSADRAPLDEAVRRLAHLAEQGSGWPDAWNELGRVKLALHDAGFAVKAAPYQPMGTDYLHGAADAFARALVSDPGNELAAEQLGVAVSRETIQPQADFALPFLQAAARDHPAPTTLLALGVVEREQRLDDSALASFEGALKHAADPGRAHLEIARTLFRLQRPEAATDEYFDGLTAQPVSRAARAEYRKDIAWIADSGELASFDALAAADAAAWIERFWGHRAAREGRVRSERLAEHYRRLEYAFRNFPALLEPRQARPQMAGNDPGLRLRAMTIPLKDRRELGRSAGQLTSRDNVYAALNGSSLLGAYRSGQNLLDDRGVVYIRYGEPVERATYNDQQTDANESWKYLTPSGTIILHFVGWSSPGHLVEQMAFDPEVYASRGGLDSRYDMLASEMQSPSPNALKPEHVLDDKQRGAEAIRIATTTDAFPTAFDARLTASIQAYGLGRPSLAEGVGLLAFAVRAEGMTPDRSGRESSALYPIRVRLIAERLNDGAIFERDTVRMFVARRPLTDDEFLTGQSILGLSPGVYAIRATLSDGRGRQGVTVLRDSVVVPDLAAPRLTMSDLVLGRAGSGQEARIPPEVVALNPLNSWPARGEAAVYYQLGGLRPGEEYHTQVEMRRRYANQKSRVVLGFVEKPRSAVETYHRNISLEHVAPGDYEVAVTVRAPDGNSVSRRQQLHVVP